MHRSHEPEIQSSDAPGGILRRWVAWGIRRPGKVLAIYWTLSFTATHIPPWREPNPDAPPAFPRDKVAHFLIFAGLSFLLMLVLRRHLRPATALLLTILIAAGYGAVDELTQPPFGRSTDIWDWVADMAGCGAGLLAWMVLPRRPDGRT